MNKERLIKSSDRVKSLGEVFTPKNIVKQMLDQPEVMEKVNDLTATILEPSAGEGAFLVEVLRRKMKVALSQSKSADKFDDKSLVALSTLYGIELMEDNVEMLVMNMFSQFSFDYQSGTKQLGGSPNKEVLESAKVIIQANMVQGNALTKIDGDGNPIVFSEWQLLPIVGNIKHQKVQRLEYTFQDILDGKEESQGVLTHKDSEELDLFDFLDEDYNPEEEEQDIKKQYAPVRITKVYKKELEG